jgi:RHS repeat-associated protein
MTASTTCAIDQARSVTAITDTYEYDAFGNLLNKTGTTPNNYLYRGEQYDPDLGLYYLRARYYNPLTGRFMSRDPEDGKIKIPATSHKYLYAEGDPIDAVDPTGRATYTNPNNRTAAGALAEYAGLALQSLNRVAFFAQVTVPAWLGTPGGKASVGAALIDLGEAETIVCYYTPGCSDTTPSLVNGPNAANPVAPFVPGKPSGQDLTETEDSPS